MSVPDADLAAIREDAVRADTLQRQARELLVRAVHKGSAAGLTQRAIGRLVGRSQPEVSRLLKHPIERRLAGLVRERRNEMLEVLASHGVTQARVFGSVATGNETAQSDLDLLVDVPANMGLMALDRLERELTELLGVPIDVVPVQSLPAHLHGRVLAEATPL